MRNNKINIFTQEKPKPLSKKYSSTKNIRHENNCTCKVMYDYFQRKLQNNANNDMKTIQYRTKNKTMTSQFTGYLDAVKDQEMPIKYIQQKRKCDQGEIPTTTNKCRLCYTDVEDVIHIITSCVKASARYYLLLRHDALASQVHTESHHQEESFKLELY